MAIDAINVGSFIPNAAGLPEGLNDTPDQASAKGAKVVTPAASTEAQGGDDSGGGGAGVDVEA